MHELIEYLNWPSTSNAGKMHELIETPDTSVAGTAARN